MTHHEIAQKRDPQHRVETQWPGIMRLQGKRAPLVRCHAEGNGRIDSQGMVRRDASYNRT